MQFLKEAAGIVRQYYSYLLTGVGYTMLLALVGTVAGFCIGLLTGVVRTAPKSRNAVLRTLHSVVNALIAVYIEVFRSTPMMVQAMVIFWGYAFLNNGETLPLIPAGLFIVSINTGAYMAEIVRGGILSIDRGQLEGAYSVGMTHTQAMTRVVLPQALRNILPSAYEQALNPMWLWGWALSRCVPMTVSYRPARNRRTNSQPIACACSGVTSPGRKDWMIW